MSRVMTRWLVAMMAVLALALAACETDEADQSDEDGDDTEEDASGDGEDPAADDEDPAADDEDPAADEEDPATDEDADDTAGEDGADDQALEPADGETIVDALRERAADEEAIAEFEEESEEAAEDEDAEAPEEPGPYYSRVTEAIEEAGLEELLESQGPFTLFAPTDGAFALVPEDTLETTMNDPDALESLVSYHIVEEEVTADDLSADDTYETVGGQTLTVRETEGGDLTIDGVEIADPDIETDNGVVHGISAVLLPPPDE